MTMFKDREDAGRKLAEALSGYRNSGAVVVGLPRGGVVLAREVADALDAPLDLVVPRKIGAEGDPEYAIGAITETGEAVWNERERASSDPAYLERAVADQQAEARRRLETYRQGLPPRDLKGKTVIIVDDGIATGLTMSAAVKTAKDEGATRVVVAAPVSSIDAADRVASEADDAVILSKPRLFRAIGGFYGDFPQVDDASVLRLMKKR